MGSGDTGKNDTGDTVRLPPDDDPPLVSAASSVVVEARGTELVVARPDALSTSLAADMRRAEAFRRQSRADNTRRGYAGDWARFQAWAATNGAPCLPAPPEVVAAHLSWLASEGYSVSSIERFLSAAGYYHDEAGLDFARNARAVRQTMKGIRHAVGTKQDKKAPLGLKALVDVCARLGADRIDLRNRALLTVGWFCALRSANLVAIRREHVRLVRVEEDGWIDNYEEPNAIIIHLPGSKTDQNKAGRDVAAYAQDEEAVCPVCALQRYFKANQFKPGDRIFPMSERTVSRLIKRLASDPTHGHKTMRAIAECEHCSLLSRRFASHSLRRGVATTLAQKGAEERDIMRQGGWKNERVMRGYIEHATPFENNPTKGLAKKKS